MDPLQSLKSLTYKGLGIDDGLGNPEEFLRDTPRTLPEPGRNLDRASHADIIGAIDRLKLECKNRRTNAKEVSRYAWRCTFLFKHTGRICNTINALQKSSKTVVRKTCSKCGSPRTNPHTILRELFELSREEIVKAFIEEDGLTLDEANIRFDEMADEQASIGESLNG